MQDLINHILSLEKLSQQLEPSSTERSELMAQVTRLADNFIATTESNPAYYAGKADHNKLKIKSSPVSLNQLLEIYKAEVIQKGINPASGGHIGYIPGGGIYTAALADYIADVSNEYAGMYFGSPGAVTIENEVISWMKEVFNFPQDAIGNLTSGGSIANLIALTAARDKYGIKNELITQSVLYLSEQVHHCIHKAIRIIGLEDVQVRYLKLDEYSKIKVDDLKKQIEADKQQGLNPFMVIASAGTTDTGAIDPLQEIGVVAQENNLWYHVDGAYGGFFILCDDKKGLFKGIEMADSLVIDPHKGLFLPYGLGAVLIKDKEAVFHSHHYTANYMQDAVNNSQINPADVSPELTKHFRGLRMWLPLNLHGIEPFIACLQEKILLTEYFRVKLIELGFKVGPAPDLSVSYFWYPTEKDINEFNERLMQLIHEDGSVFLSSTKIKEQYVIRIAILSFRTKKATIDKAMLMIEECLNKTRKEFG